MGSERKGKREADSGVPQAWVWSHYQGWLPSEVEQEQEQAGQEDPMLFEQKGQHPVATALGLVISIAIILALVWLFTPTPPSSLPGGSPSDEQSFKSSPGNREATVSKEAPASPFGRQEAVNTKSTNPAAADVENKLRAFLEHGPGTEAVFDLDRVSFGAGTATLTPTAREELQRLARVLRAYSKTHVAVGVHSDVGGSSAQIETLSAERARNVRSELIRLGIGHASLMVMGRRKSPVSASSVARPGCVWIDVRKE